jgi:pimeloyl-ACP methyl ester carboxylesterase
VPKLVQPWFDALQVPSKRLIIMRDAGHSAMLTEPGAFLDLLLRYVRPVAMAQN